MTEGVLYFDLASPFAYLALERAESVLGRVPELEPILLGAIFGWRGWGSWAETAERTLRTAEIADRARRYGLPPVRWPSGWPGNSLRAMRAATVAKRHDRVAPFARAVFRHQFAAGEALSDELIAAAATEAGLAPGAVLAEIETREIKAALRQATERAWEVGVKGVPSLRWHGTLFYGDDQLDAAARAADAP